MQQFTINAIEKEFIPFLTLNNEEVLFEDGQKLQRTILLNTAMLLGNCFKDKVTLVFQSEEGIYAVKTTVWAVTEQAVILKGGVVLPISSVVDVKIFG
jgi:hypothetical protein